MQDFTPWAPGIAVAFKFSEGLVEEFAFAGAWASAMQEIVFLKLAKAFENLRASIGIEVWQFCEDFSFAHGRKLASAWVGGKTHRINRYWNHSIRVPGLRRFCPSRRTLWGSSFRGQICVHNYIDELNGGKCRMEKWRELKIVAADKKLEGDLGAAISALEAAAQLAEAPHETSLIQNSLAALYRRNGDMNRAERAARERFG